MATPTIAAAKVPSTGTGGRSLLARLRPLLGTVPFFAYTIIFLLIPTVIVAIGSFRDSAGHFSLVNFRALSGPGIWASLWSSVRLSVVTAVIGAIVGGLLAYVISTAGPRSLLRRVMVSASSVLAQFGGVMLAFAFLSTLGPTGLVSRILTDTVGVVVDPNYLSSLSGVMLVYAYFQIPLMVIVFLPAVDGMKLQWREATESLGGSTWAFWRYVGGPLMLPSFLGSMMLLFANAFSAYATAAVLLGTNSSLFVLQIASSLTSETGAGAPNLAKAESLIMVLVVTIVMIGYFRLQRRTSKWLG